MILSPPPPPFLHPSLTFPDNAEAYALALLYDTSNPGMQGQPYAASQFWFLEAGNWASLPVGAPVSGVIPALAGKPFYFVALDVAAPKPAIPISYWMITRQNQLDISQPFIEDLPGTGRLPAPWADMPGPLPGGNCYLLTQATFRDAKSMINAMLYYRITAQCELGNDLYIFSHDPEMEMDPGT